MSYFPRADQVEPFGHAFLKLMFAYAELDGGSLRYRTPRLVLLTETGFRP